MVPPLRYCVGGMQTYFLGLFATAAVVLGLGVGFAIGFAQISAGRFSPSVGTLALRDRLVWLLLLFLTAVMLSLGAGALVLSLPPPRPLVLGLSVDQERLTAACAGLVVLVASLGALAALAARVGGYANAPRLARLVVSRVRVPETLGLLPALDSRPSESYPFLPVFELLNQAIRDGDRATVTRTLAAIRSSWPRWITDVPDFSRSSVVAAICDSFLSDIPELIDRHGVPSLHRVYIPEIVALAGDTYELRRDLMPTVLEHAERTLVRLILAGEDEAAAPGVAALFELEARLQGDGQAALAAHRVLGSIGQAVGCLLPAPLGYAFNAPGFGYLDDSRSDVVDALRQGYSELCERRKKLAEPDDAFIWLEAMEVTAAALLTRGVETSNYPAVAEHVQSMVLDFVDAARALAYDGGSDWGLKRAIFALDRLSRIEATGAGAEGILGCLADVTVEAGQVAEDIGLEWFAGGPAVDKAIDALSNIPTQYWKHAIDEGQMRRIAEKPGQDARWRFTTKAGARLRTNFGMMFDWETGELYPDNDPRRR